MTRFGNDSGLLYKCAGDLRYLGKDPNIYANLTIGNSHVYEPKTSAAKNFTQFAEMIEILNLAPPNTFAAEFEAIFDVDSFIQTYIMEVMTGNWDGIYDGNNYYLYKDPTINKWRYFRHDLDLSFGMFEFLMAGNFSSKNVYRWYVGGRGFILPSKILSVTNFVNVYTKYMLQALDEYFNPTSSLINTALALKQSAGPAVIQDMWHTIDYAWTYQEFEVSFNSSIVRDTIPKVSSSGIFPFIEERYTTSKQQIQAFLNSKE